MSTEPTPSSTWFRPPRAHGEALEHRTVSFLELFYDLVFVVLIAQLAHTLADEVTWAAVRDFVVVFGLVWFAWFNGTLYHDLHGGDDGRSRTYVFVQMTLLVPLAVFAGHAATDADDGFGFALVYTLLLLLIAWQWFDVLRVDTAAWRAAAMPYLVGILAVAAVVGGSTVVATPEARVMVWTAAVVLVLAGNAGFALRPAPQEVLAALRPTESLVERFGLFTIIVLGEVVVGVADGLSEVDHGVVAIVTGVLALQVGFGFWWNYFDLVGGRRPRLGGASTVWVLGHFALALGIAGAGAGMVGLVEHANDGRTPAPTAWLLAAATAVVALSIAALTQTIERHPGRRLVPVTLVAAAGGALVVGAARPVPWLLALALLALLSVVWLEAFRRHARHGVSIADGV